MVLQKETQTLVSLVFYHHEMPFLRNGFCHPKFVCIVLNLNENKLDCSFT
jgi:hypothetical protein